MKLSLSHTHARTHGNALLIKALASALWTIGVRFPAGAGNFSLNYRVQNGSGAHPASYPMGTRDSFPGDKATGA
jgi:hypothetical protein